MTTIPPIDEHPIQQTLSEPLQQLLKQQASDARDAKARDKLAVSELEPVRFRPLHRPPLALLTILDDGSDTEGELLRIRTTRLTVGRTGCDVCIPFDPDMSAMHATLECVYQRGEYRWFLADQSSTNGTFLRAYKARPKHGAEMIIGSRRYDFQTTSATENPVKADPEQTITYVKPADGGSFSATPRLVEVTGTNAPAAILPLNSDEVTVGQAASCDIQIKDDPLVSPQHVKFTKDQQRRWLLEDQKSVNGVWIRITRIALAHQAEFQMGQQRFVFEVR